jgi:hypothetical protein
LRIVFRPEEPNNPDGRSITLDQMVLGIFSSTGSTLFTAELGSPLVIPDADPSHPGPTGFVFRLQTDDLAAAAAAFSSEANRIGLAASVSGATGGHDWFYVTSAIQAAGSLPLQENPEPASCILAGAGLVAIGLARRMLPLLSRIPAWISTLIS